MSGGKGDKRGILPLLFATKGSGDLAVPYLPMAERLVVT